MLTFLEIRSPKGGKEAEKGGLFEDLAKIKNVILVCSNSYFDNVVDSYQCPICRRCNGRSLWRNFTYA